MVPGDFKIGQMAIHYGTGQVGMVAAIGDALITLKFGADGPYQTYPASQLDWATPQEIIDSGLPQGVGFTASSEADEDRVEALRDAT